MNATDRWDADSPLPDPRADRPVTIAHRAELKAGEALMAWSKRQGIDDASKKMGSFARRFGPKIRSVQRRGLDNLALTMPETSRARREAILASAWENLGRTVAEYAHLPTLLDRTEVIQADRLKPFTEGGQSAILFSGHFANWEALPAKLHAMGLRYAAVYRAANNPLVDDLIIKTRAEVTSRRLIPKGLRGNRELIGAVNEGLSICMLADQKLNEGIEAPLLGVPAKTAAAAARLALKKDLPLIPIQIVRGRGAHFRMTVHEPIMPSPTGDQAADTLALVTEMNAWLSRFIAEEPGQWLWFHRRWPKETLAAALAAQASGRERTNTASGG